MRKPTLLVVLVLFPALLVYARLLYAPCDDTYIFLVYARSFLEGKGLTYNGTLVEGFSSVLWVTLLALLGLLRVPLPLLSEILSALSGLALLLATVRLARSVGLDGTRSLLPAVLIAATGDVAFYAACGLEHVAFAALVAAAACALAADEPRAVLHSYRYPVLLAGMILLRPEGALVAGLFLLVLAIGARSLLPAVRCGLVLTAVLAPVLLVKHAYFGYWLPNTYYAKSGARLENLDQGLEYLRGSLPRYGVPGAAALVLGLLALWRARRAAFERTWGLWLTGAVWLAYVAALGGDNMVGGRVLIPVLPLAFVGLVQLLHALWPRLAPSGLATAALAACLVLGYASDRGVARQAETWRSAFPIRRDTGLYLAEHFPADTLVAVNVAGIIPYYSRLPTIDMLGLNDEFIAHHGKRDREQRFGHQAGDGEYVLSQRPGVILFGGRSRNHAANYIGDQEIWESERFRADYTPVTMFEDAWAYVRNDLVD